MAIDLDTRRCVVLGFEDASISAQDDHVPGMVGSNQGAGNGTSELALTTIGGDRHVDQCIYPDAFDAANDAILSEYAHSEERDPEVVMAGGVPFAALVALAWRFSTSPLFQNLLSSSPKLRRMRDSIVGVRFWLSNARFQLNSAWVGFRANYTNFSKALDREISALNSDRLYAHFEILLKDTPEYSQQLVRLSKFINKRAAGAMAKYLQSNMAVVDNAGIPLGQDALTRAGFGVVNLAHSFMPSTNALAPLIPQVKNWFPHAREVVIRVLERDPARLQRIVTGTATGHDIQTVSNAASSHVSRLMANPVLHRVVMTTRPPGPW